MLRRWFAFCLPLALLACGHGSERLPAPPQRVQQTIRQEGVPDQARVVLRSVRHHGQAPEGVEGGRHFGNFEHRLPEQDASGKPLRYQEWDLWPKVRGRNRGAERLVTGSDGRAWYTGDHYRTFIEVKE